MGFKIKGAGPMRVLGIDPSTSATGWVLLRETGEKVPFVEMWEEFAPPKKLTGLDRAINITTHMIQVIQAQKPDKIVIEGFSLNTKNASSIIPLVELGTLIRFCMKYDGLSWYDPRASELKKFVCGKGNANKEVVMMNVLKRWGFESPTNNVADAYGLACMGLAQANRLPGITLEMIKIAGAMSIRSN